MKNNKLIEKYFSRTLTQKELEDFNILYNENLEFKDEVNFLENLKIVSEKEDTANFKSKLQEFEEKAAYRDNNKIREWLKPLIAISAVFVIGLSISFFWDSALNEKQLFNNYFEVSKNVSSPIVRSEVDNIQNQAFIAYSKNDFNKAYTLFEEVYKSTKNSELLFYQGNSLLASDKTQESIRKFKEHLTFSDSLTNRSHWYLALAYLKIKKIDQAKQELEVFLSSNEDFKKEEASSLLKKLN